MNKTDKKYQDISTADKAGLVARWLEEKQGRDIVVLDVRGICSITENIIIVSAKGVRHAQALSDFVLESLAERKLEYLGMEGYKSGDWILLDLNDIIVHVFLDDVRSFYNLEGLWADGEPVDWKIE